MAKSKSRWSYSAGEKNRNRVRAFEHSSGILMLEFYERSDRKRLSLGHRDRERAKQQADEAATKLGKRESLKPAERTLRELFEMYLGEVSPKKSLTVQRMDRQTERMFLGLLGPSRKACTLSQRDVEAFIHARANGRIGPGRPVGPRTIEKNLRWLLAVLNWATLAGDGEGGYLMTRNPLKGLPLPKEENPHRPMVTSRRYQSMLDVADRVDWRFAVALVLAHETGHRIGAISRLRWSDIDMDDESVRWRKCNDKIGMEHDTPLTPAAISALKDAMIQAPGIGDAWIFPAPRDSSNACSRHLMRDWWRRAERLGGLERIKGLGWHGLRRKFATELKGVPLPDLCQLGGWKTSRTILECYQQPDRETQRQALLSRQELRSWGA